MHIKDIANHIMQHAPNGQRYLVAIAGPPASGKSTLAAQLSDLINEQSGQPVSTVVPMDGFHLDNDTLDQLGQRHRKGAAHTFDSVGFVALVKRLKTEKGNISIPLFDRNIDAVVPDAKTVTPDQRILLIEGNYLLLDEAPWSELQAVYDWRIMLNPGIEVLEERLIQRWLEHGYDQASAEQRALSNDIPNARFVVENSLEGDVLPGG